MPQSIRHVEGPQWPISAVHLFSGSFCGWSQALEAIGKFEQFQHVSQQIYVDSDPRTMQNWANQFVKPVHFGPTPPEHPWCPSSHVGICTPVNDCTLCHQVRVRTNLVGTASPPCVTWSKAGRAQGLNSAAGYSSKLCFSPLFFSQTSKSLNAPMRSLSIHILD